MKNAESVALVLGSGGARGMAHIGIINWLEANGYHIHSVAGSSMGALIGGVYAAGKLPEFTHWLQALTRTDIVNLLDFSFGRTGLFKGEKIVEALQALIGVHRIEDLPISFTAIATDVELGKEVWFNSGPLFDAVRASIAVPMFFTPVMHKGRMLMDGGLVNPVPIAPTFGDDTDITIAVNLGGTYDPDLNVTSSVAERFNGIDKYSTRIKAFIAGLQNKSQSTPQRDLGMLETLSLSFETMQGSIARMKLASYAPDHVIEIPRNVCRSLEYDRADEIIAYGEKRAAEELAHLVKPRG